MDEAAAAGAGQGRGQRQRPFTEMVITWQYTGDGERPYRAVAGGAELVVQVNDFPAEPLYTLLVNGQPGPDLEDWPAAWTRPGNPVSYVTASQLSGAAASQLRGGRLDAIVAAAWARTLCEQPPGGASAVVAALGLAGTLTAAVGGQRLEPPPPGTTRFEVAESAGDVAFVRVTLAAPVAGRADLDALLGPGSDVPRVHYDQPYPVCYRVSAAGAPYTCDLFADFDDAPGDGGPARSLLLRRQPA
jgi:hypothetical protein